MYTKETAPLLHGASLRRTIAPMSATARRVGEMVEAASDRFVAQCYTLYEAPTLGSLVRAGEEFPAYGVVASVVTSSLDPTRRVVARGAEAASETDVYLQNPQLEHLLRTDFEAVVTGHIANGVLHHYLPPVPPRIHSFVEICSSEEARQFSERLDFLALLTATRGPTTDDVLAACLRHLAMAQPDPKEFVDRAAREVASLLAGETQRLNQVLRRLS